MALPEEGADSTLLHSCRAQMHQPARVVVEDVFLVLSDLVASTLQSAACKDMLRYQNLSAEVSSVAQVRAEKR